MKYLFTGLTLLSLSTASLAQTPAPVVPAPAVAANPPAPVLTLHEALQTALKNSLDLQIAQNTVEVQRLQNTLGFAGGLPTVGLAANNNVVINNTNQEFNTGQTAARTGARSTQYSVGLAGSYLLYNGGYVVANRARLNELQQISELQLNSTVQNVLADVSLKYYAVVQQQRYIRTLQASVEVSRQKLRLIEARQAVGLANNADRFQAQLDLNAQLETQGQQALAAQQATADLLRALTLDVSTPVALEDTIPVSRDLRWADIQSSLTRNPALLAADRQVRVNELLERVARANRYPSLGLNAGTNFARNQNAVGTTLFNQSYGPYAGFGIALPIYSGGVNKRLVDVARVNTKTAELQRSALQQNYQLNARKAWEAYEQTLALVDTAEASYTTARNLLKLVQMRLDAGLSTLVDVKLAQQSYEDAGYRLVNYRYTAKSAEITLQQLAALTRYLSKKVTLANHCSYQALTFGTHPNPLSTMELLIRNLSKTYANGVRALHDVSLTIPNGMFGLLGPNGAGKSSLMRTIATLQEPDFGTITLGNLDVLTQKDAVRQVLGYLPQEFGLYPSISAEVLLDHFASLKGIRDGHERKLAVEALLHQTNLWSARKKNLGGYSGGMRQRFGIAVALLGAPQLIIVDEPTAGLDPTERNRFLDLLSEIGENVVVILSTHIVEDVTELCSNMAIIAGGQVVATGQPNDVIGELRGKVYRTKTEKAALAQLKSEYEVISSKLVAGQPVVRVFSDTPINGQFQPADATLEDVYFHRLARKSQNSEQVTASNSGQ